MLTAAEYSGLRDLRRQLAVRFGWPAGVVEACERLELEHRAWIVWWRGVTCWHPAGFLASRVGSDVQVCGGTCEDVAYAMELAPASADRVFLRHRCCHRGRL